MLHLSGRAPIKHGRRRCATRRRDTLDGRAGAAVAVLSEKAGQDSGSPAGKVSYTRAPPMKGCADPRCAPAVRVSTQAQGSRKKKAGQEHGAGPARLGLDVLQEIEAR
jgi:hypothetical protein